MTEETIGETVLDNGDTLTLDRYEDDQGRARFAVWHRTESGNNRDLWQGGDYGEALEAFDKAEDETCHRCGESNTGGDGFDGLCGSCADAAEDAGEWSQGDEPVEVPRKAAPPQFTESERQLRASEAYRELADGLSDMVEGGRLTEADVPDDYQWLVATLERIATFDPSEGG